MPQSSLYDEDFHAWANEQAALLRQGKLGQVDLEHIALEIESMGRTERRELVSRLTVLMLHLPQMAVSTHSARQELAADH